jgi:hypothetical protein
LKYGTQPAYIRLLTAVNAFCLRAKVLRPFHFSAKSFYPFIAVRLSRVKNVLDNHSSKGSRVGKLKKGLLCPSMDP